MASTIKSVKSIVPLLDRVVVQRFKAESKTASGLYLPSSATKTPLPEAHVVAAGPGARNKEGVTIPTSVKAGDKVLLPGWGGNSIKVGDEVRACLCSSGSVCHALLFSSRFLICLLVPKRNTLSSGTAKFSPNSTSNPEGSQCTLVNIRNAAMSRGSPISSG